MRDTKVICPNNENHNRFIATAIVYQVWIVDEHGNYLETRDEAVETHTVPDPNDNWQCADCLSEALVMRWTEGIGYLVEGGAE